MAVNKHQDSPRKTKAEPILFRKKLIKKYFDKYIEFSENYKKEHNISNSYNVPEFLKEYLSILQEAENELTYIEYNTLRKAILNDLKSCGML